MSLYIDAQQSLLKFCKDLINEYGLEDSWQVFDFDSHASLNKAPEGLNLIGVGEYSIDDEQGQFVVTCYIALSTTHEDANLITLRPVVDKVFNRLKTGYQGVRLVQADTGVDLGNFVVQRGTRVLPVSRTDTRPLILVAVSFGLSLLAPP